MEQLSFNEKLLFGSMTIPVLSNGKTDIAPMNLLAKVSGQMAEEMPIWRALSKAVQLTQLSAELTRPILYDGQRYLLPWITLLRPKVSLAMGWEMSMSLEMLEAPRISVRC